MAKRRPIPAAARHAMRWATSEVTREFAMWAAGELLPSQKPNSMMRCPCGETFDSHRLEHTVVHVPHITTARVAAGKPPPSPIPKRNRLTARVAKLHASA